MKIMKLFMILEFVDEDKNKILMVMMMMILMMIVMIMVISIVDKIVYLNKM